jgi:hypothetical protein
MPRGRRCASTRCNASVGQSLSETTLPILLSVTFNGRLDRFLYGTGRIGCSSKCSFLPRGQRPSRAECKAQQIVQSMQTESIQNNQEIPKMISRFGPMLLLLMPVCPRNVPFGCMGAAYLNSDSNPFFPCMNLTWREAQSQSMKTLKGI